MHPAMQALIKTKWELFGRLGASGGFLVHFIYVCLWTLLAVTLPRDANYYTKKHWRLYWRLPLEVLSVFMTFYFILKVSYSSWQLCEFLIVSPEGKIYIWPYFEWVSFGPWWNPFNTFNGHIFPQLITWSGCLFLIATVSESDLN